MAAETIAATLLLVDLRTVFERCTLVEDVVELVEFEDIVDDVNNCCCCCWEGEFSDFGLWIVRVLSIESRLIISCMVLRRWIRRCLLTNDCGGVLRCGLLLFTLPTVVSDEDEEEVDDSIIGLVVEVVVELLFVLINSFVFVFVLGLEDDEVESTSESLLLLLLLLLLRRLLLFVFVLLLLLLLNLLFVLLFLLLLLFISAVVVDKSTFELYTVVRVDAATTCCFDDCCFGCL